MDTNGGGSWAHTAGISDKEALTNMTDRVLVPLAKYAEKKGLYLVLFPAGCR